MSPAYKSYKPLNLKLQKKITTKFYFSQRAVMIKLWNFIELQG